MKSILLANPFEVRIAEVPDAGPRDGEALLRMRYGGICGSDLASYRGTSAYVSYPRTLGHEFSAEVVSVPSGEHGLAPGMAVTGNPYFNCGTCYPCRRGIANACVNNQTMGVQREGAFAEYFSLPVERVYPAQGVDPRALALIEPFAISHHAVVQADVTAEDSVLVIGAGAIGILAAVTARSRGARVHICDISEVKAHRAAAEQGLAGGFAVDEPGALRAHAGELTGGDGFDVVVEATGAAAVFRDATEVAASLGRVVEVGVSKSGVDFNPLVLQRKELTVVGSRAATRADFDGAMALVRRGAVDLDRLVTAEYPMERASEAFEYVDQNAGAVIKALFEF